MNQKTENERNFFHINLNCHSQVIWVQYHNLQVGKERKCIGEEKAIDLTLKQGDCQIVVEGIYLLSDKEFTVFTPSRDIK